MSEPAKKKTSRRVVILFAIGVALIAAGIWQRDYLTTQYLGYQLRKAAEAERAELAKSLAYKAPHGQRLLVKLLDDTDSSLSVACRSGFEAYLNDPQVSASEKQALLTRLNEAGTSFKENGRLALLELIPTIHQAKIPDATTTTKHWLQQAFASPSAEEKVKAIAVVMQNDLEQLPQILPLLNDPEASVRRAVVLALGPVREGKPNLLDDEDLLKCLHDGDDEVRQLGLLALRSRGRNAREIALGKRYTHPQASERQKLLNDLALEDELDVTVWLERLTHDKDASVRAGAARLMTSAEKPDLERVKAMINADPDPTVRRIAYFYFEKNRQ